MILRTRRNRLTLLLLKVREFIGIYLALSGRILFVRTLRRRIHPLKKTSSPITPKVDRDQHGRTPSRPDLPAVHRPETVKREILVPASVRIAREKAAARLQAVRDRAAAKAKTRAAREERANAMAAMRIAKTLDRKAALMEKEAAKLDRKAQRVAHQLALKDRRAEQRLAQRAAVKKTAPRKAVRSSTRKTPAKRSTTG